MTNLICPHCEKELEQGHSCRPKLTRRFFFGLLAGAAATAFTPSTTDEVWKWWRPDDIVGPRDRILMPTGYKSIADWPSIYAGIMDPRRFILGRRANELESTPGWLSDESGIPPASDLISFKLQPIAGQRIRARRVGDHRIVEVTYA